MVSLSIAVILSGLEDQQRITNQAKDEWKHQLGIRDNMIRDALEDQDITSRTISRLTGLTRQQLYNIQNSPTYAPGPKDV